MNNLLISVIGNESIHDIWLKKNRNYDVILICYDDEIYQKIRKQRKPSLRVYRKDGFHFPLIKWLYNKYKLNYERFLFINHDIFITTDEINYCFEYQEKYSVKIGHPAVNPRNNPTGCLKQNIENVITWTNWIELMAVFFEKEALDFIIDSFDENNTGYGYPELWRAKLKELKAKKLDFAVFDQVEIIHTRPVDSGNSIYKANNQTLIEAKADMFALFEKFKLEKKPYEEIGIVLKRHLCASVTIYPEEEWDKYMYDHLRVVPSWMEHIQVKTVPIPEIEYKALENDIKITRNLGGLVQAEYYYREGTEKEPLRYFDFSHARNRAKSIATAQWVFSIDADERYLQQQHELIFDILKDVPANIGGVWVTNFGKDHVHKEIGGNFSRFAIGQVKIFRNLEEIYWQDAIHETISESIKKAGFILAESDIAVMHVGYQITDEEMRTKKSYRNLMLHVRNPELLESEGHLKQFVDSCIDYKILTDKKGK